MKCLFCMIVLCYCLACHAGEVRFELVTDDLLTLQDSTAWISVADIDQDGLIDILASRPHSSMSLYEQTEPSGITFSLIDTVSFYTCPSHYCVRSSLIDYDFDGLQDLIVRYSYYQSHYNRYEQVTPFSYHFYYQDSDFETTSGDIIPQKIGVFYDTNQDSLIEYYGSGASGLNKYEQTEPGSSVYALLDNDYCNLYWENGWYLIPAFGNIDGDDYLDMLVFDWSYLEWWEMSSISGEFEYVADLDGPEVNRPYIYLSDIDDNGYDDLLCIHGWKVEYWRNMAGSSSHDESVKSCNNLSVYPNPFRDEVKLELARDTANHQAVVDIYNLRGQKVRSLRLDREGSGVWDGRDANNRPVASGVYFCRLSAGGEAVTHKMLLLR